MDLPCFSRGPLLAPDGSQRGDPALFWQISKSLISYIFDVYLLPTTNPPSSPCSHLVCLSVRSLIRQDRSWDTRPSSQRPTYTIPTKDNGKECPNDSSPNVTGFFVCPRPAPPPLRCQGMVVFVLCCLPTMRALFFDEAHDHDRGDAGDGVKASRRQCSKRHT